MNLTQNSVDVKLPRYITLLVVSGVSCGNFTVVGLGLCHEGILP